jgi:hypothetical protein
MTPPTKHCWVVMHHHRHGTDTHIVACSHEPTEVEVVRALCLDFEPDIGEDIDIYRAPIITIP